MNTEESVKVRFGPGETGWGLRLAPDRVRINNIPYSDRLNIDDLVEVDPDDVGLLDVKRVLARSFEKKTAVDYEEPYRENYAKLWGAWHAAGMKCEGILPGLAVVAHHADQDPMKAATTANVKASLHDTQPDLEPIDGDA